jgi:hypothetical protein
VPVGTEAISLEGLTDLVAEMDKYQKVSSDCDFILRIFMFVAGES